MVYTDSLTLIGLSTISIQFNSIQFNDTNTMNELFYLKNRKKDEFLFEKERVKIVLIESLSHRLVSRHDKQNSLFLTEIP